MARMRLQAARGHARRAVCAARAGAEIGTSGAFYVCSATRAHPRGGASLGLPGPAPGRLSDFPAHGQISLSFRELSSPWPGHRLSEGRASAFVSCPKHLAHFRWSVNVVQLDVKGEGVGLA